MSLRVRQTSTEVAKNRYATKTQGSEETYTGMKRAVGLNSCTMASLRPMIWAR
jgi:hypothetical protein